MFLQRHTLTRNWIRRPTCTKIFLTRCQKFSQKKWTHSPNHILEVNPSKYRTSNSRNWDSFQAYSMECHNQIKLNFPRKTLQKGNFSENHEAKTHAEQTQKSVQHKSKLSPLFFSLLLLIKDNLSHIPCNNMLLKGSLFLRRYAIPKTSD